MLITDDNGSIITIRIFNMNNQTNHHDGDHDNLKNEQSYKTGTMIPIELAPFNINWQWLIGETVSHPLYFLHSWSNLRYFHFSVGSLKPWKCVDHLTRPFVRWYGGWLVGWQATGLGIWMNIEQWLAVTGDWFISDSFTNTGDILDGKRPLLAISVNSKDHTPVPSNGHQLRGAKPKEAEA